MVSVDLIASGDTVSHFHAVVSGYLVMRENEIALLDIKIEDDWKQTPYILIEHPDLKYALMTQLPLMGGGVSIFFHLSEVEGTVDFRPQHGVYIIRPTVIRARETRQAEPKEIDFCPTAIQNGKERFKKSEQLPDYYEELGLQGPKYS